MPSLTSHPPQATNAAYTDAAIHALKTGGTAVLMGGREDNVSVHYAQLMIKGVTIRGNFMYPSIAPIELVHLVASGQISLMPLETHIVPFEELHLGIDAAKKHNGIMEVTALSVASLWEK